jgi:hypothetical protein
MVIRRVSLPITPRAISPCHFVSVIHFLTSLLSPNAFGGESLARRHKTHHSAIGIMSALFTMTLFEAFLGSLSTNGGRTEGKVCIRRRT